MSIESGNVSTLRTRLVLLKHLDSVIDFSRATSQLELVLFLYSAKRPITTDELARALGCSKKAVLDSLRKLERKELIYKEKEGDELKVALSERGIEFVHKILELLRPTSTASSGTTLPVPVRLSLAKEVTMIMNLYKLITYIGLVRSNKPTRIKDIAKKINLNKNDIDVIVSSFTQTPTKLFRLVKVNGEDALLLDREGLEILRRTVHYRVYSSNRLYKFFVDFTKSPWISEMMLKLNSLVIGVTALVVIALVVLRTESWIITIVLLLSLAPILLIDAYIYTQSQGES